MLVADRGTYDYETDIVDVDSQVLFEAADGYRMTARGVNIDLDAKSLVGTGGIEGAVPAGTFSADTLRADLAARTVALVGNARLHMTPGKMRMPR